jgi:cell shape-determining protein MreC
MELNLRQEVVNNTVLRARIRRSSRRLVNSSSLKAEETGLEERLWSAEPGSKLISFMAPHSWMRRTVHCRS